MPEYEGCRTTDAIPHRPTHAVTPPYGPDARLIAGGGSLAPRSINRSRPRAKSTRVRVALRATFCVVGLVAVLSAGCCGRAQPKPIASRDAQRLYHLRQSTIEDGRTTLAELEARIGPPDLKHAGGAAKAYTWEVVRPGQFRPDAFDHGIHDERERNMVRHFLLLDVDADGVVRRHERRRYKLIDGPLPTIGEVLDAWERASAPESRVP